MLGMVVTWLGFKSKWYLTFYKGTFASLCRNVQYVNISCHHDVFTITRFTLYFSCPVPHCLSLYMFLLACSLFACLLTNGLPLKTPPSKVTIRSYTKVVFRGPAPVRSSRTGRWPMKSVWTPWRTSSRKPGSSPRKPTRNTMRSLYGSLDVVWFGLSCLQYACDEYFITMPSVASSCIIKSRFFHSR